MAGRRRFPVPLLRWSHHYGSPEALLLLPHVSTAVPAFAVWLYAGCARKYWRVDPLEARRLLRLVRAATADGEPDADDPRLLQARLAFLSLCHGAAARSHAASLLAKQQAEIVGVRSAARRWSKPGARPARRDAEIRKLAAAGAATSDLADRYGLTARRIQQILSAK